jgi:hypothetical protein
MSEVKPSEPTGHVVSFSYSFWSTSNPSPLVGEGRVGGSSLWPTPDPPPWYGWTCQAPDFEFFRSPTSPPGLWPGEAVTSAFSLLKAILSMLFLLRQDGGPGHDANVTTVDQSGIRVLDNAVSDPSGAVPRSTSGRPRHEWLGPRVGRGFPRSVLTSWTGPPLRRLAPTGGVNATQSGRLTLRSSRGQQHLLTGDRPDEAH